MHSTYTDGNCTEINKFPEDFYLAWRVRFFFFSSQSPAAIFGTSKTAEGDPRPRFKDTQSKLLLTDTLSIWLTESRAFRSDAGVTRLSCRRGLLFTVHEWAHRLVYAATLPAPFTTSHFSLFSGRRKRSWSRQRPPEVSLLGCGKGFMTTAGEPEWPRLQPGVWGWDYTSRTSGRGYT